MSVSSRTAVAVHALAYLARWPDGRLISSAEVAESLASNPALVRRILGSLREAGIVDATEGRGGGWRLARRAREITLADVYAAVEESPLLAPHPHLPNTACVIGRHIEGVLRTEFDEAEEALRTRLRTTTVAEILDGVLTEERRATG